MLLGRPRALPLAALASFAALAWMVACSDDPDPAPARPDAGARDSGTASLLRNCALDLDQDGLPRHLDCTGLYADALQKDIAEGVSPYTPAIEFWSDALAKKRFVQLPPGSTIDVSDFDEWRFPNGTKVWKEFWLGGKRVETRLFTKSDSGEWKHTVYRWDAEEKEASRLDTGEKIAVEGKPVYEIPSSAKCDQCHGGRLEPLLGFDAVSLGLPGAEGTTLAALASDGRLSQAPPATSLAIPDDGTGKGVDALGWLHANCGACHSPNEGANARFSKLYFRIRATQLVPGGVTSGTALDALQTACADGGTVPSTRTDDAGVPYMKLAPGQPDRSAIAVLAGRRVAAPEDPSPYQMPPIVTRVVDAAGHGKLVDWIAAVPACPAPQ